MALEISVAGSAGRLQQANATSYTLNQRATDTARATSQQDFDRIVEEERRAEIVARENARIRNKRDDIRADTDRRQIDDLRVRALEDRRIADRIDRQIADQRADDAEAQRLRAELNDPGVPFASDGEPLTPTAPQADTFQQYLADRDARRLQQRAREGDQALQQQIELRRSERAVSEFRANPEAVSGNVERGSLVDFRA